MILCSLLPSRTEPELLASAEIFPAWITRDERKGVAEEAAKDVGLSDKLDSAAGDLSGGQRRKLSVAIAFMGDPAIVFLVRIAVTTVNITEQPSSRSNIRSRGRSQCLAN